MFGEPDILVNSAGINLRPPMDELDEEAWDATMAVNLEAPYLLGRRFGPGMAERGFGRIIHITSQQAHRAFVQSGAYGVSKGALESLARSQAEAWSPHGVTCNTLVPGFVMTPLNARLSSDPEKVAALAARTMVGRNGLAEDFAGAAVFLAAAPPATSPGRRSSSTAASPCTEPRTACKPNRPLTRLETESGAQVRPRSRVVAPRWGGYCSARAGWHQQGR